MFILAYQNTELWTLPSAQQQGGALFVIPRQLGLFEEVFSRWESITKNHVSFQGFTDVRDKIEYMENLLGEVEKLTWIQWRMSYPSEYESLINIAEGREGTQNISQPCSDTIVCRARESERELMNFQTN